MNWRIYESMKAQINQAFIFIFMIIIIGSIAIVGFQLFAKGRMATCDADITNFKINLEKLASSFTDYGTVNVKKIKAPCNYEEVCIITTEDLPGSEGRSGEGGGGSDYFIINQYLNKIHYQVFRERTKS